MTGSSRCSAALIGIVVLLAGLTGTQDCAAQGAGASHASEADRGDAPTVPVEKHRYTGTVVRLIDALKRRGIKSSPEVDGHIVLETETGELLPILADWRGRAFYQDERLRDRKVTIVANRRADMAYLQPLMVFTYDAEGRPQFTDYWCDICSIPMYEIQPCECCQGDVRLRYTLQPLPDDVPIWGTNTATGVSARP